MDYKLRIVFAAIFLSMAAGVGTFGQAASTSKAERELLKIQTEWAAARVKRDVPYLEKLYSREFWISNMNGTVTTREQDIAAFASGDLRPESVINEEMIVHVYGKNAIVTGIEKVKGTYKTFPGDFTFRFTNVYTRRDGRWQLVAHHSTPVQKPE